MSLPCSLPPGFRGSRRGNVSDGVSLTGAHTSTACARLQRDVRAGAAPERKQQQQQLCRLGGTSVVQGNRLVPPQCCCRMTWDCDGRSQRPLMWKPTVVPHRAPFTPHPKLLIPSLGYRSPFLPSPPRRRDSEGNSIIWMLSV